MSWLRQDSVHSRPQSSCLLHVTDGVSHAQKRRALGSRMDSDKQAGLADGLPKTLSKTAGVPKTLVWNEKFVILPLFLSDQADVVWASCGYNHLYYIFLNLACFAISAQKKNWKTVTKMSQPVAVIGGEVKSKRRWKYQRRKVASGTFLN